MNPLLLNIETATDICSVSISSGSDILVLKEADKPYMHASSLTLLIERCLEETGHSLKDMDCLAISSGPGSYTSLRVGSSVAKGICYALGKKLVQVDTLQSLARAASATIEGSDWWYCPMIDARRMEVYSAVFDERVRSVSATEALVIEPGTFDEYFGDGRKLVFCGNGAEKCREVLRDKPAMFLPLKCSAAFLAPLASALYDQGKFADPAYYTPRYLKPPNITKPRKTKGLKT